MASRQRQLHCFVSKAEPCTGGVGPTIMETSYLLAGTPVIAYADGKQIEAKPISQPITVDFGKGLGRKTTWLYNLPEVESAFKYMKVPNVSARFGTDPGKLPLTLSHHSIHTSQTAHITVFSSHSVDIWWQAFATSVVPIIKFQVYEGSQCQPPLCYRPWLVVTKAFYNNVFSYHSTVTTKHCHITVSLSDGRHLQCQMCRWVGLK